MFNTNSLKKSVKTGKACFALNTKVMFLQTKSYDKSHKLGVYIFETLSDP